MKIAIVGAGIAGNVVARRLHEAGHAITVFEAGDHVGGHTVVAGEGYAPAFPKARYVFTRAEWDYWTAPDVANAPGNPYVRDSVLPLKSAADVELVDGEHRLSDEIAINRRVLRSALATNDAYAARLTGACSAATYRDGAPPVAGRSGVLLNRRG